MASKTHMLVSNGSTPALPKWESKRHSTASTPQGITQPQPLQHALPPLLTHVLLCAITTPSSCSHAGSRTHTNPSSQPLQGAGDAHTAGLGCASLGEAEPTASGPPPAALLLPQLFVPWSKSLAQSDYSARSHLVIP